MLRHHLQSPFRTPRRKLRAAPPYAIVSVNMQRALNLFFWACIVGAAAFCIRRNPIFRDYRAILGPLRVGKTDHSSSRPGIRFCHHCGRRTISIDRLSHTGRYSWRTHVLTGWDIRSEYVYLMAAMYGAFLIQAITLWRIGGRRKDGWYLGVIALLSIFSFSPCGHNNHWWSMMIPLHFANLFLVLALISIATSPCSWSSKTSYRAFSAGWLPTPSAVA